jgi:hypothetical protein
VSRLGLETHSTTALDGWSITHRPDLDAADVLRHVLEHRDRARAGTTNDLKTGSTTSTARGSLATAAGSLDVATKWFRWRGLRRALGNVFYGSRVARALGGAHRLQALGLHTPETLAVAERSGLGLVREGVLITEFLSEARSLPEELCHLVDARQEALDLASALGHGLGTFHAAGVSHPDLKISNIMVCPGGPHLSWIDLDALIPPRSLTWSRRVRALGQLEAYTRYLAPWILARARVTFLRAYLSHDSNLVSKRRSLVDEARAWATAKCSAWEARQVTLPPDRLPPASDPSPTR